MKVAELIAELQQMDPIAEVCVLRERELYPVEEVGESDGSNIDEPEHWPAPAVILHISDEPARIEVEP